MWLGAVDSEGRLYIDIGGPLPSSSYAGGLRRTATGAVNVTENTPQVFVNGLGASHTAELCIAPGGVISTYVMGLPMTEVGRLVTQADLTPNANDPYVAGIRVGPLGGVYTTSAAPPVAGNAPVNTVRPELTGINTLGSTLTCSQGTWIGDPTITYAYQWYQGNTPLIGQTATTHVITTGDVSSALFCRVTASNSSGGTDAFSDLVVAGAATYNYKNTTDQFPLPGYIYHNFPSLNLRISKVDANGIDRSAIGQLKAGDTITIGSQTGTLANAPTVNSDHFIVSMISWPQLADGTYAATVNLL